MTDRDLKPVFNPGFVPVMLEENTIHIRAGPWTDPIFTIHDEDGDGDLAELVASIDGTNSIEEILAATAPTNRDEVASFLDRMVDRNVLLDARNLDVDPSCGYLSVTPYFDEANRTPLSGTTLAVVNDGRIGPQVVEDALDAGVGRVVVADESPERYERPGIRARDDSVTRTATDREELHVALERADAAVFTVDRPRPDLATTVNELAYALETPWMLGQVHGYEGLVGPQVFPDVTACYECFTERLQANVTNPDGYERYREVGAAPGDYPDRSTSGLCRIVAGFVWTDVAHLLAYDKGFTAGRLLAVDGMDLGVEIDDVLAFPRCSTCGKDPGDDVERFVGLQEMADAGRFDGGSE